MRQYDYSWSNVQREGAICLALQLPYAQRDEGSPQGQIHLFSLPEKQLAALAGRMFFVFGLNGFLNFIPPPPNEPVPEFAAALFATGYMISSKGQKRWPDCCSS